jgi:hypothetical protein
MLKKTVILIIIIFSFSVEGLSQNRSLGINLMLGLPQGEFKQNIDRAGVGIAGQFLYTPNNSMPMSFGINFGYLNYGDENRDERFSPNIPDVMVNVDRKNNLVNLHLMAQFGPSKGLIRPYLEGLLGGSYIFTITEISDDYGYSDKIASSKNFDDFAWSYGGGGGVAIYLTRFEDKEKTELGLFDLFLDFKIRYLYGTKARYLKEGSVTIRNGYAYYDVYESTTDVLSVQMGVIICF